MKKTQNLTHLQDDGCIQIDNFEYESWFIGNKEYVFFMPQGKKPSN